MDIKANRASWLKMPIPSISYSTAHKGGFVVGVLLLCWGCVDQRCERVGIKHKKWTNELYVIDTVLTYANPHKLLYCLRGVLCYVWRESVEERCERVGMQYIQDPTKFWWLMWYTHVSACSQNVMLTRKMGGEWQEWESNMKNRVCHTTSSCSCSY